MTSASPAPRPTPIPLRPTPRVVPRVEWRAVVHVALLLFFAVIFIVPLLVMIASAFKADELQLMQEIGTWKAIIPSTPSLQNFVDVFRRMRFLRFALNSIIVVTGIIAGGLLVNSMMAYALARLRFRGRRLLLTLIVAMMIMPFEGIAIPLLMLVNRLGWIDSYHVQIVPFLAHPFSIFLFYQFFIGIPREFDEAALVDGASRARVYWSIILPLSRPVIATVSILQALEYWGAFLWPLMVTRGETYRPLTVAIQTFFGQYPRDWGDTMAFATMMTVPVLILFLAFQSWFIQSLTSSGLKG
ncbi:MAG TPA: carbohydrate ABC transporter permease [Limnochordales bacterium]